MAKKRTTTARTKQGTRKTTQGFSTWQLALMGLSAIIASYIFASLAIDSGSYWHYIFMFASAYIAVKFLAQSISTFMKESKK